MPANLFRHHQKAADKQAEGVERIGVIETGTNARGHKGTKERFCFPLRVS